ncbi:MAG TPA: sugar ABC transporter ATP-binding protein [Chryseolinea sp.]|nr:sugar ABC transporter ATP-binding protein [Chryseolinea sp.]
MLQLRQISKSFPGVKALRSVDLDVRAGEIHALCGENGAGKSTLMNILAGNLQPDAGAITINGTDTRLHTPADAFALGIGIVYQHLSLIDSMSVAENIFANQQPVNAWGLIRFHELYRRTQALLKALNLESISPSTTVSSLTPAQRQMVEIAKALSRDPTLFILDEPTAALSEKETVTLFMILRSMRGAGIAIIYISHRLEEIFRLADRVTIIKDGASQGTFEAKALTRPMLISKMVGRELANHAPSPERGGPVVLEVNGLSGRKFRDVSFRLHAGEILGLAGLVGAGRTEIARALFGVDPYRGLVRLHGKAFHPRHPADAIQRAIAYVPEDRQRSGIFPSMSLRDNVIAAALPRVSRRGLYREQIASEKVLAAKASLRISATSLTQPVGLLSGGNQQKVMLARWLMTHPEVLIVDEPTHGIDVGAKYEIYELLEALAQKGTAVLVISSEMPELIGLCSRLLVIREGRISGTLTGSEITEEHIMSLAAI